MQRANEVRIRVARENDRNRFAALWADFLREQCALDPRLAISKDAPERWRNDFPEWIGANVHGLFVAEHDEAELVGFASVHLWYPPPIYDQVLEAYLDELFVTPEWRRRGVASTLLDRVKEWAVQREAHRIRLGVLDSNTTGLTFWQSRGARPFVSTMLIDV
ncbi:MAG TPA: GNAT family N-acetyltransferase [Rhodothermales bacterium]|nr:GNAT family N-acetyltransferase [Rhodothermales bacterium]